MKTYLIALMCVIGISFGQFLFKLSAIAFKDKNNFFTPSVLISFFLAIFLYGITSLAWVWLLQKVELSKIYPIMALGFIFVPIGSYFIFNERLSTNYIIGIFLIFFGLIFTTRS